MNLSCLTGTLLHGLWQQKTPREKKKINFVAFGSDVHADLIRGTLAFSVPASGKVAFCTGLDFNNFPTANW